MEAPSEDFFTELQRRFVSLPVVAEDLGHITADVRETMQRFGFPGMRVLLFGFSGNPALNPNAVQNIPEHCVVYTGTHDNNTARGWFEKEASRSDKHRLSVVSGRRVAAHEISWELIRLAMLSPARWSIIPIQDLLGLGAARTHQHAGDSPRQLGLAHDGKAVRCPAGKTPARDDNHLWPRLIFSERLRVGVIRELRVTGALPRHPPVILSQFSTWVNTRKRSYTLRWALRP